MFVVDSRIIGTLHGKESNMECFTQNVWKIMTSPLTTIFVLLKEKKENI